MPPKQLSLDARGAELAATLGLGESEILAVARAIMDAAEAHDLNLAEKLVIGLDVNGPVVAVDNNDLMPLPGAKECVEYLLSLDGVKVSLMTGWDLSSMTFFRQERMALPALGIVGEYGMVYKKGDEVVFIYPYNEAEALGFIKTAIDLAADRGLKFAIQGNYSSGVGPLIIEADHNGNLFEHPLVKGRIPTIEKLYEEAKAGGSDVELIDSKVHFTNIVEGIKGIFEALARKHPLISVRFRRVEGERCSFEIDHDDKPGFTYKSLEEVGALIEEKTGRRCMIYEDFGIDAFAKAVDEGDYYKQAGLDAYGKDVLAGEPFVKIIVGDRANDAPRIFEGTLFCPQKGTQAEEYAAEKNIPSAIVGDVRDFAIAMGAIRASL